MLHEKILHLIITSYSAALEPRATCRASGFPALSRPVAAACDVSRQWVPGLRPKYARIVRRNNIYNVYVIILKLLT
jgi:hypothetical protein